MPSPNVAEDHQTKNAMALVNKSAAILVEDKHVQEQLIDVVEENIFNTERLNQLKLNIKELGFPNSAETIANEVIKLANK